MFLRFSKGSYSREFGYLHTIRKCVLLGNSVVMEYGSKIVGIAKLHEETEKCFDWDIVVASECELGAKTIATYIKNLIGKSNKFSEKPSDKRRKYYVEEIKSKELPVKAQIIFAQA